MFSILRKLEELVLDKEKHTHEKIRKTYSTCEEIVLDKGKINILDKGKLTCKEIVLDKKKRMRKAIALVLHAVHV